VQDGCDNHCAYCIVPAARGVPRSVPVDAVVAQAGALVAAGAREIVLTGINLGRFSDGEVQLPGLVTAVARTGIYRLRLSSIEPPDVTPELLDVFQAERAVCPHLHVPLQSGSDEVLRAMGRSYTVAEYVEVVARAREACPGLAVSTDVIAGLPGEAEEHHRATMALCEQVGFARMHVFRYSERAGTRAAALPQVDPRTRSRRAEELRELGAELSDRYARQQVGSRAEMLVETVNSGGVAGTTRDYLRVHAPGSSAQPGTLLDVRLEAGRDGSLWGHICDATNAT
jgi:threonylcarbamoyladenosine tRNA methylthiotransferase MtaB